MIIDKITNPYFAEWTKNRFSFFLLRMDEKVGCILFICLLTKRTLWPMGFFSERMKVAV